MTKLAPQAVLLALCASACCPSFASDSSTQNGAIELPPITSYGFKNTHYKTADENGSKHLIEPNRMSVFTSLASGQGSAITLDLQYAKNSVNLTGSGKHTLESIVSGTKLLGSKAAIEVVAIYDNGHKHLAKTSLSTRRIAQLTEMLTHALNNMSVTSNKPVLVNKFNVQPDAHKSNDVMRIIIRNRTPHETSS